jgi:transposase
VVQQDLLENVFKIVPPEKLALLSKEDLIILLQGEQDLRRQIAADNDRLRALNNELEQKSLFVNEKLITLKNELFGKSSEKSPSRASVADHELKQKEKKQKIQLPSLRYPNAPLIERHVELEVMPECKCCGKNLSDSGMTEDSEFLTVVPAEFYVVRQRLHKYRCTSCHGDIQTAPAPPRVKAGSSYSDEMIIDVAAAKYCDLVPVERYATIAGRAGLEDLPANSLIETTHYLADLIEPVYEDLKADIKDSKILHADETPHRMLEGDRDKKSWYLWGFSNEQASYFEIRGTRSGKVASSLLTSSKCEFLVSDAFGGYPKAVTEVNIERKKLNLNLLPIQNVYCNAHARRKFKEAEKYFPDEAKFFIDHYKEIYRLNKETKETPSLLAENRAKMEPFLDEMKEQALSMIDGFSSKSSISVAINYFLKNFDHLTLFVKNHELPLDNNSQERLMRNPVIGRKTWYGTHSKRGAKTAAILFSIVESCKLNNVNPRAYLKKLIAAIHGEKTHFTPAQFKSTLT